MTKRPALVPQAARVDYDPLLDNLSVAFGDAEGIDLDEVVEGLWAEFDDSAVGRCVRVYASGATLARPPQWAAMLADLVGPDIVDAWDQQRRKSGRVSSLQVELGSKRDALGCVWESVHRSMLAAQRVKPPARHPVEPGRREGVAAALGEWLRRGLGFPLGGVALQAATTRHWAHSQAPPDVVNLSLSDELAAALGVGPVAVITVRDEDAEVRLTVTGDQQWLVDNLGVAGVEPSSPTARFAATTPGYVSARLQLDTPVVPGAHVVVRLVAPSPQL